MTNEAYAAKLAEFNSAVSDAHCRVETLKAQLAEAEAEETMAMSRYSGFVGETFVKQLKDFLGDSVAVLDVFQPNYGNGERMPPRETPWTGRGYRIFPAKLQETRPYVRDDYAAVTWVSGRMVMATTGYVPCMTDASIYYPSLTNIPFLPEGLYLPVIYIPLRTFGEAKVCLDHTFDDCTAKARSSVTEFLGSFDGNAVMSCAGGITYIVADRTDGQPGKYSIALNEYTGIPDFRSDCKGPLNCGDAKAITHSECSEMLGQMLEGIGVRYREFLADAEEWFDGLEPN